MTIMAFNAFCDQSFAELLSLSPEVAGELGVSHIGGQRIPQHRFSDISASGIAARQALMAQTLTTLETYNSSDLDEEQRISYRVYHDFLQSGHFGRLRGVLANPTLQCDQLLNHLNGVQAEILTCLSEWHGFSDRDSLSDYLARLHSIPKVLADLREQLDARAAEGQVVPESLLRRVCAEIEAWLALDIRECAVFIRFCEGIEQIGSERDTAASLQQTALASLETHVFPAYRKLLQYLLEDYPGNEHRIGLCRLPDGPAYYQYLLAASTTTSLSPQQIHELGKVELEHLQISMQRELLQQGYAGDCFATQLAAFERDARFQIPATESRDEVLGRTEAIIAAVRDPFLNTLGIKPVGEIVVKAIPQHQEANAHSRYTPGSANGTRPGIFYLNLAHLKEQSMHGLTTLTYHEAYPGHHVQLTIAQELGDGLPQFRKILVHDAYIEGWAKYAEILPWQQGFNTDPCWNLSRQRNELFSTANLVLDTGIHALGWSREQGIDFFMENTAAGREFAEVIIDRITAIPAQVCAYKIGMMTVLAAQKRMAEALASKFRLADFHDAILKHGSIPLSLLDEQIDKTIAALA